MKFNLLNVRMLLKESFTRDEALDTHFDCTIVQGYLVTFPELSSEPRTIDYAQIVILSRQSRVIRNVDRHARGKLNWLVLDQRADEHAFQVNKDWTGCTKFVAGTRNVANDLAHFLRFEIVHIEPGNIHASLHELFDLGCCLVLITDCADNLRRSMTVMGTAYNWGEDLLLKHLYYLVRLVRRLILVFIFIYQAPLLVPHHLATSGKTRSLGILCAYGRGSNLETQVVFDCVLT